MQSCDRAFPMRKASAHDYAAHVSTSICHEWNAQRHNAVINVLLLPYKCIDILLYYTAFCREGLPRAAYLLAEIAADHEKLGLPIYFGQPVRKSRDMSLCRLPMNSSRVDKGT